MTEESTNIKFEILPFLKKIFTRTPVIVGAILAFFIGKNWNIVIDNIHIPKWGYQEAIIVKDYLNVIIWPFIVFIFGKTFQVNISTFLNNSKPSGVGPLATTPIDSQANPPPVSSGNIVTPSNLIKSSDSDSRTAEKTSDQSKIYKFRYWDLFFVENTKEVLTWIHNTHPTINEYIAHNLAYPQENPKEQKQIIINILETEKLIEAGEEQRIVATPIAIEFLKSIHRIS